MSFHALLFTLLLGQITDKTTGQPLHGVQVVLTGATRAKVRSDAQGRFRIPNVHPGAYLLTLSSDDVLPTHRAVRVHGKQMTLQIPVCSTTLDYSCGGPGGGGGG
jgi:hypothetical protein